jgi:hypothetical protein
MCLQERRARNYREDRRPQVLIEINNPAVCARSDNKRRPGRPRKKNRAAKRHSACRGLRRDVYCCSSILPITDCIYRSFEPVAQKRSGELNYARNRILRKPGDCSSPQPVVCLVDDESRHHERRSMLLRNDVLRFHVIWREEMAGLESVTSRNLNWTHRQKLIWQVGFLFCGEIDPGSRFPEVE